MSKPTEDDILNAKTYMEDNEETLDEFIEYLKGMDPLDFRKYWGTLDPEELRKAMVSETEPTEDDILNAKTYMEDKVGDRVRILRGTHAGKSGTVTEFLLWADAPLRVAVDGTALMAALTPDEVEILPPEPVSETTAETAAQAFCDLAFPHGADATNADEYRALYNGFVAGWIARGVEDGVSESKPHNGGIDITGLLASGPELDYVVKVDGQIVARYATPEEALREMQRIHNGRPSANVTADRG